MGILDEKAAVTTGGRSLRVQVDQAFNHLPAKTLAEDPEVEGERRVVFLSSDVEFEKVEALIDAFRDRLPLGRVATADEIASVIAFLASEDTRFINGAIVPVNGGLNASNGQPNFLKLFAR
jgi:NAD(P)-dependent dehydrogenase (short-subunit alcohol dehydrogenase family)